MSSKELAKGSQSNDILLIPSVHLKLSLALIFSLMTNYFFSVYLNKLAAEPKTEYETPVFDPAFPPPGDTAVL